MTYEIVSNPSPEIFRAYDIRGIYPDVLNKNITYTLGLALGSLAQTQSQTSIIVGHDHRYSSHPLCHALCEGLRKTGIHVINIGQLATPLLYFATYFLKIPNGIMITGSHCEAQYNGFKMILGGKVLADEAIQDLLHRMQEKNFLFNKKEGDYVEKNITAQYIDDITQRISPFAKKNKIVIDAGHGMLSELAPAVFKKLQCDVIPLYCNIDPNFPDHHPDPSQPENLQDLIHAVKTHHADLGIAFDGDGDRIGVVTGEGKIIWPDRLLAAYAKEVLKNTPGATIIYDVKCTRHLQPFIESCGGHALLWKTGHSHIKTKMKETQAILAGEMSGHIFFSDNWYGFDDALYAAVRLISLLSTQALSCHDFFKLIPDSVNTPELKLPMEEEKKFPFIDQFIKNSIFHTGKKIIIDGLRVEYDDGFGLIRASNTSPYLILRFEGLTTEALTRIQNEFRKNLLNLAPKLLSLPF